MGSDGAGSGSAAGDGEEHMSNEGHHRHVAFAAPHWTTGSLKPEPA